MPDPVYDSAYQFIRELARVYAYGRFDQFLACQLGAPVVHSDQFATRAASEGTIVANFAALYDTMIDEGEHLVYQSDGRPSVDVAPLDLEDFTPAVDL